jgi:RHS repeat-associated protein
MGLAMELAINDGPGAFTAYGFRKRHASRVSFNGQRYDLMTGCYPLGHGYRSFSPVLMRFLSPDALSPFAQGGRNAYAYCLGDPVNGDDPSGQMPRFMKVIGEVFFGKRSSAQRSEKEVLRINQVLQEEKRQAGAQFSAFEGMFDLGAPEYKRSRIVDYLKGLSNNSFERTEARSRSIGETISLLQSAEVVSDPSRLDLPLPKDILPSHARRINLYRNAVLMSQAPGTSARAKASEVALEMAYGKLKGDINKSLNKHLKRLRQTP